MSIAIDFQNVFIYREPAETVDNFSARIFRLIAKADTTNMARLRLGWPVHVGLYEWWMAQSLPRPALSLIQEKEAELIRYYRWEQ